MRASKKNMKSLINLLFPSSPREEVEAAGARVLDRLRGQFPEAFQAFQFPPDLTAKAESLSPGEQLFLRAIYLTPGGYGLDVFSKAEELAQKRLKRGTYYVATDHLLDRGLISKELTTHNGRVQARFALTEFGQRVLAEAVPAERAEQEAIENFGYFA